jgi:hypothetical protein
MRSVLVVLDQAPLSSMPRVARAISVRHVGGVDDNSGKQPEHVR